MHRLGSVRSALALCAVLLPVAFGARVAAQNATPVGGSERRVETLVLVEHNDNIFQLDAGPTGPSAGDWQVWGPNPLYDETNATDTGATTQGTCFNLPSGVGCYANETIVFADGSTLEIQGIEGGEVRSSTRTIVGGSGRYLDAAGTVTVASTDDQSEWTKTLDVVFPARS